MAPSSGCPATRTWPGNAALRLAGTPGPRVTGTRPPVTTANALPSG